MPTNSRRRVTSRLAILLLAGTLAGCASAPPASVAPASADAVTIAVVDRGWHTDIALPADQISGPLAVLARSSPGARYLVFGFGDRAYFMTREETVGQTLTALFPGPGVILLTGLRATPVEAFGAGNVVMLRLPRPAFDHVAEFVWMTLAIPGGAAQRLADGPYAGSAFYASGTTYDALDNCNAWTVRALHHGQLPVDTALVLFAEQVMGQARRLATAPGESTPP
jgi:hypothetical protein